MEELRTHKDDLVHNMNIKSFAPFLPLPRLLARDHVYQRGRSALTQEELVDCRPDDHWESMIQRELDCCRFELISATQTLKNNLLSWKARDGQTFEREFHRVDKKFRTKTRELATEYVCLRDWSRKEAIARENSPLVGVDLSF